MRHGHEIVKAEVQTKTKTKTESIKILLLLLLELMMMRRGERKRRGRGGRRGRCCQGVVVLREPVEVLRRNHGMGMMKLGRQGMDGCRKRGGPPCCPPPGKGS